MGDQDGLALGPWNSRRHQIERALVWLTDRRGSDLRPSERAHLACSIAFLATDEFPEQRERAIDVFDEMVGGSTRPFRVELRQSAVALGVLGERARPPWRSKFSVGLNHTALSPTLVGGGHGVLEIL